MRVVIIGGVAGGAGAATRLRRLDESAEIIILERGDMISYANCGLPYYLGGVITEKGALSVATPEFLKIRFNIDVRVRSEAVKIDREAHTVTVKDERGEYLLSYDKLILATGARANTFGLGGDGVFVLKDVADTLGLDEYIDRNGVGKVVVAGGGFIGIETAENLRERGLEVILSELQPHILPPIDPEFAVVCEDELRNNGITVKTGAGIKSISGKDGKLTVVFTDGSETDAGAVVLAMGVTPESGLVKDFAALFLGAVVTDPEFKIAPDIYAAGDVIAVKDAFDKDTKVPLAGPANRQGRSVADNIEGIADDNGRRVLGASVVKIFNIVAASVGKSERALKAAGEEYLKVYAFPMSHAGYYPGGKQLKMKLLFAPDGKILGAQAIGEQYAEKQIDVISAVMHFGGTVYDLEQMELCYAPPFNSAKSPVNMLGFIAHNVKSGLCPTVYPEDLTDDSFVLDVRNPSELRFGGIPGAVNIPLDMLRDNLDKLPKDKKIVASCAVGLRGYLAVRILRQHGFDACNLSGGYSLYRLYKRI